MQPMIMKCNMDQNQIIFRAVPFLVLCFLAVSDSNNANAWMIDECRMRRVAGAGPREIHGRLLLHPQLVPPHRCVFMMCVFHFL